MTRDEMRLFWRLAIIALLIGGALGLFTADWFWSCDVSGCGYHHISEIVR